MMPACAVRQPSVQCKGDLVTCPHSSLVLNLSPTYPVPTEECDEGMEGWAEDPATAGAVATADIYQIIFP